MDNQEKANRIGTTLTEELVKHLVAHRVLRDPNRVDDALAAISAEEVGLLADAGHRRRDGQVLERALGAERRVDLYNAPQMDL